MAADTTSIQNSKSAQVRARLGHPIIDSDGHTFENASILGEYIESVAGPEVVKRFRAQIRGGNPNVPMSDSLEQAREHHVTRGPWWGVAARNTRDRATAMLPKLLYERLPEMGLDFSVVYTTIGFGLPAIEDEELRRAACRGLNRMRTEMFAEFSDRLTPAAVIPMHTPQEACEELEYAVKELGMKAAMVASYVRRPIPIVARKYPELASYAYWMDVYGIDSDYDYDPFWAKCQELGIAPTFHSLGYTWGSRQSISNYVYNHVGNFAASAEAICKGIFLGGVPGRFPKLNFGFLEGGVAWAVMCYCDLISHWHKRGAKGIEHLNPANIDQEMFADLVRRYARRKTEGDLATLGGSPAHQPLPRGSGFALDEFEASGVRSPEDIRDVFVDRFYFGCEGDDPLNAMAFHGRGIPLGAKLKALYGSDIGHWDVPDMADVAHESYELVEEGLMDQDDLREFVFDNAIRFWTINNPNFFTGTAVENAVAQRRAELKLA